MKNLKLPFSLFLCLFFLFTSTTSQAITTTTSVNKTETKISTKQQAKLERLKKKLSKKMAKIKTGKTATEQIQRNANLSFTFGVSSLIFLIGLSFWPYAFVTLPFCLITTVMSFIFARKAIKAIRKSENQAAYEKQKKRANSGRYFAIAVTTIVAILSSLFLLVTQYIDF